MKCYLWYRAHVCTTHDFEPTYSLERKSNAPQDSITMKIERAFSLQPIHVILLEEENFEIYALGSEKAPVAQR